MVQINLSCSDARELRQLVDHDHPELSVSRQCVLLGLPQSTCYRPTPVRESTLRIIARIYALYLEEPYSGSRRMVDHLVREGIAIDWDRMPHFLRCMSLQAIYQKPFTHIPGDPSDRYLCLVDVNQVTAVDPIWATEITYIPLQNGFLRHVAIIDTFYRSVLG